MVYEIDRNELFQLIDEEVSRVAGVTYADSGVSLYDVIRIKSPDFPTIVRLEDDAIDHFVRRTMDICTVEDSSLVFDVPDFDENNTEMTRREITRYIVLNVCATWFLTAVRGRVEEYAKMAEEAMNKAITYLKTIKAPVR